MFAVGVTILMAIILTIRQTFFGIRPDKRSSYPTPPRVLVTPFKVNALPILGHTPFFRLDGGSLYHRFCETWTQYGRFIPCHGRRLGNCFALFIWGQWRVMLIGKKRANLFFDKIVSRTVVARGDDVNVAGNGDGNGNDAVLEPAWAYFNPRPLLGSNCPAMMHDLEDRRVLLNLFGGVLTHEKSVRFTEEFGIVADGFVTNLLEGKLESTLGGRGDSAFKCLKRRKPKATAVHPQKYYDGAEAGNTEVNAFHIGSHTLRHFSFDLINGPLLGLGIISDELKQQHKRHQQQQQQQQKQQQQKQQQQKSGYIGKLQRGSKASGDSDVSMTSSKEMCKEEFCDTIYPDETAPSREKILTWMRRIQKGLLGFRFTIGGKWMQIWRLNEYGRAIHVRNDIMNTLLSDHISKKSEMLQTQRPAGTNTIDPLITPNPIYTFATQFEHHIANMNKKTKRRNSAPSERGFYIENDDVSIANNDFSINSDMESSVPSLKTIVSPTLNIRQEIDLNSNEDANDLGRIVYGHEPPPAASRGGMTYPYSGGIGIEDHEQPPQVLSAASEIVSSSRLAKKESARARALSDTELPIKTDLLTQFKKQEDQAKKGIYQGQDGISGHSNDIDKNDNLEASNKIDCKGLEPPNLLDDFLAQEDDDGNVISQAAVTDLSLLLWLSLDAGSAWTSMALQLLQHDPNALQTIRNELNYIERLHGANYFAHLGEAKYLDAVVYEAVRLCPPFCGGMWITRRTVELEGDGLQVPTGTNVIFADVTTRPFDLEHAWGKKAQDLVHAYPTRQLYGFLPLDGKEIPLMVLQSKILLAAILRRCNICSQDVEKCNSDNRRTKEGYYMHSSCDDEADEKITRMEDNRYKATKSTPQRGGDKQSERVDDRNDMFKGKEHVVYMGVTHSGACAQLMLTPTISKQSDLSFSSHSNSSTEVDTGAIRVETLLNSSISPNVDDGCSTSTSDSTALQVLSFEYPHGDEFSEHEHDLSQVSSDNSISMPSSSPYMKGSTQQNTDRHDLTPEECGNWFTKLPFPESLNSVVVTARYRASV